MNLEDKAREYAEGKSSASVFRDAHIRDFKAGYKQALEDTKAFEMLEMLKKHLSILYDIEMEDSGDNIYVKNLIIETRQLIKEATEL